MLYNKEIHAAAFCLQSDGLVVEDKNGYFFYNFLLHLSKTSSNRSRLRSCGSTEITLCNTVSTYRQVFTYDGYKALDPTHCHFFNHEQNADFDIVIKELSYFEDPIKSELLIQGMEFQPIEVHEEIEKFNKISILDEEEYWEANLPNDYQRYLQMSDKPLQYTHKKELYTSIFMTVSLVIMAIWACEAFVPRVLCEYPCALSKLCTCCYCEVSPGENMLGLCEAMKVVNDDDQGIGAYMFCRTIPFIHLAPADVHWMLGAWKDKNFIYNGLYGPFPTLIKAFLDFGAKAVICPSTQPEHETKLTSFHGSCDFSELENVKFKIGLEEVEEEEDCEATTTSPNSD
ncbi:hypothetical protein Tco_1003623 [Tanacetum coccineum]|uniref:Uncharacterized protein n=1 Tax=Tanacetum coccineum TaxID=301880 RepID=A0ABQ5FB20_9ASTR